MFLMRCKNEVGQDVYEIESYSWQWQRFSAVPHPDNKDYVIPERISEGCKLKEGEYQGVVLGVKLPNKTGMLEFMVAPANFGQIILENSSGKTVDNFRLKIYTEKGGLKTC